MNGHLRFWVSTVFQPKLMTAVYPESSGLPDFCMDGPTHPFMDSHLLIDGRNTILTGGIIDQSVVNIIFTHLNYYDYYYYYLVRKKAKINI